jgi:hypothetical protein
MDVLPFLILLAALVGTGVAVLLGWTPDSRDADTWSSEHGGRRLP